MALFAKAKKTGTKKTAKKDDKIIIDVEGKEFAEKLEKFANLKSQIDDLTSELNMAKEIVKEVGTEEYVKLITSKKTNTGSFIIASETGGRVMVAPTKKYIKIDEEGAETLQETYGDDIVSENTVYAFNTKILMKNMDVIEKLIEESEEISDADKESLIEAKVTYSIEKDSLDKVYTLAKESGNDIADVIDDLQPIIMLKNAKA